STKLGRRGERRGDAPEDHVDVRAGEADGANADERDERHEQRVLEEVLRLVVVHEHPEPSDEIHVLPSVASPRPNAVCAKCDHALLHGSRDGPGKRNGCATDVFAGAAHTRNCDDGGAVSWRARVAAEGARTAAPHTPLGHIRNRASEFRAKPCVAKRNTPCDSVLKPAKTAHFCSGMAIAL